MTDHIPEETRGVAMSPRNVIISTLMSLVEPLGAVIPGKVEIVLHDLSMLPSSIIAIYGNLTSRRVGDPATDLLLKQSVTGFRSIIGYEARLDDGTPLRSSTIIVRDPMGEPVAAICINADVTVWTQLEDLSHQLRALFMSRKDNDVAALDAVPASDQPVESFPSNVDELSAHLLQEAIQQIGVPIEKMKKEHKRDVVRQVRTRGFFQIREAAEHIADVLGVSRFTIYNYLNEIVAEEDAAAAEAQDVVTLGSARKDHIS